jgi:hypothetical protein
MTKYDVTPFQDQWFPPHMSSKRKSQPTKIMDDHFRTPQAPPPQQASPLLFAMTSSAASSPSHVDSLTMSYANHLKSGEENSAANFKSATNLHELAQLEYIRILAHQQQQVKSSDELFINSVWRNFS